MQRKSLYTGQHIFIFDYRNRFRRCNAQTLIFTVANFRVDYEIDVKITKLQRERGAVPGRGCAHRRPNALTEKEPHSRKLCLGKKLKKVHGVI